ncbi:MAG: hypothetical protein HOV66_22840 [Streptomycetaceae bacterium]|nr:hypothetical protein [Streptomycetaceae bacterium]NUS57666.1 hypothetical protein [Streptomycetaceae bacterium]
MGKNIVELLGIFFVLAGLVGLVIAAALVSVALAVGVASFIAIFAGASTVYLANINRSQTPKADPR